jgi:hypothetical protein
MLIYVNLRKNLLIGAVLNVKRSGKKPTCAGGFHSPFGGVMYSACLKVTQETTCRLLDTGTSVRHVVRQQATVKYRPSFINKYVTMTWKCTKHLHLYCIHSQPWRPVAKLHVLKKVR